MIWTPALVYAPLWTGRTNPTENPTIKPTIAPRRRFGASLGNTGMGEATGASMVTTFKYCCFCRVWVLQSPPSSKPCCSYIVLLLLSPDPFQFAGVHRVDRKHRIEQVNCLHRAESERAGLPARLCRCGCRFGRCCQRLVQGIHHRRCLSRVFEYADARFRRVFAIFLRAPGPLYPLASTSQALRMCGSFKGRPILSADDRL